MSLWTDMKKMIDKRFSLSYNAHEKTIEDFVRTGDPREAVESGDIASLLIEPVRLVPT